MILIKLLFDEDTKNMLIERDFNNKEIIKPLLRGRDINKWRYFYKDLYIILIKYGDGNNIENQYNSIFNYLKFHEDKLKKRGQVKVGQHHWLELDNNPSKKYLDLFEKEKIIYSEISNEPSFTLDINKNFLGNTAYIINSETINLRYLLGLLNSNVLFWIFQKICYNLGKTGFRFLKNFMEQLPLIIDENFQNVIINLVNELLELNFNIQKNELMMFDYLFDELDIKITKKLENFYLLSNDEFLKEIKKKNKNLNEEKLIDIFEVTKRNINNLNLKIYSKTNELNTVVYKLYNLNEKEIRIIEKGI